MAIASLGLVLFCAILICSLLFHSDWNRIEVYRFVNLPFCTSGAARHRLPFLQFFLFLMLIPYSTRRSTVTEFPSTTLILPRIALPPGTPLTAPRKAGEVKRVGLESDPPWRHVIFMIFVCLQLFACRPSCWSMVTTVCFTSGSDCGRVCQSPGVVVHAHNCLGAVSHCQSSCRRSYHKLPHFSLTH